MKAHPRLFPVIVLVALAVVGWQVSVLKAEISSMRRSQESTGRQVKALNSKLAVRKGYLPAALRPVLNRIRGAVVPVKVEGFNNGSGVIYQSQGSETYVLTAEHVVRPAKQQQTSISVALKGDWHTAALIDWDADADLAVLKINAEALAADIATRPVAVGDRVIAIGGPPGLEGSVSSGDISGTGRHVEPSDGSRDSGYDGLVQTTVAVTAGSSGGGLFNTKGELVGIISLSGDDYAYAVPIARAYEKLLR